MAKKRKQKRGQRIRLPGTARRYTDSYGNQISYRKWLKTQGRATPGKGKVAEKLRRGELPARKLRKGVLERVQTVLNQIPGARSLTRIAKSVRSTAATLRKALGFEGKRVVRKRGTLSLRTDRVLSVFIPKARGGYYIARVAGDDKRIAGEYRRWGEDMITAGERGKGERHQRAFDAFLKRW